jgi:hypothetical protein
MSFTRLYLVLVFLLALGHGVAPAAEVEVAGGYSLLRDQDLSTNLHGWFASVGGSMGGGFGVIGEAGGNYKTADILGTDIKTSIHTFLAGPRFTARPSAGFSVFGQVLFGVARASTEVSEGGSNTETDFGFQPGGGVDIGVRNFAVRLEGDFRGIRSNGRTSREGRFIAGLVFRIGP